MCNWRCDVNPVDSIVYKTIESKLTTFNLSEIIALKISRSIAKSEVILLTILFHGSAIAAYHSISPSVRV